MLVELLRDGVGVHDQGFLNFLGRKAGVDFALGNRKLLCPRLTKRRVRHFESSGCSGGQPTSKPFRMENFGMRLVKLADANSRQVWHLRSGY